MSGATLSTLRYALTRGRGVISFDGYGAAPFAVRLVTQRRQRTPLSLCRFGRGTTEPDAVAGNRHSVGSRPKTLPSPSGAAAAAAPSPSAPPSPSALPSARRLSALTESSEGSSDVVPREHDDSPLESPASDIYADL